MAGPPMLSKDQGAQLLTAAWSLTWTGIASICLVLVLYLEAFNVPFDKSLDAYREFLATQPPSAMVKTLETIRMLPSTPQRGHDEVQRDASGARKLTTVDINLAMVILFGTSMVATGLALGPLYRGDPSDVGRQTAEET